MIQTRPSRVRPATARDAISAYQTAAWRAPAANRFDSRPANDFAIQADEVSRQAIVAQTVEMEPMPRWLVIVAGVLIAAVLGVLLGGMMSI